MICEQCGRANRPGSTFCQQCGHNLLEDSAGKRASRSRPPWQDWRLWLAATGGALVLGTGVAVAMHVPHDSHQASARTSPSSYPNPSQPSHSSSQQTTHAPSRSPNPSPQQTSSSPSRSSQTDPHTQPSHTPSQTTTQEGTAGSSSAPTPVNPGWQTDTITLMDNSVSLAIPQNVLVAKREENNGVYWTQRQDVSTPTQVTIAVDMGKPPTVGDGMVASGSGSFHSHHNIEGGPGAYGTVVFKVDNGWFVLTVSVQPGQISWLTKIEQSLHVQKDDAAQTSPSPSPSQSNGTVTVSGSIVNGQAFLPVIIWQNTAQGWIHETGQALLDTGGTNQNILNGTALTQAGGQDNPGLGTIQQGGIGTGTVTGYYWPQIFVAPLANPQAYFIANQTLTSGLGPLVDQQEILNIGLGTLDHGQFMVHGDTWTWTYTPQG